MFDIEVHGIRNATDIERAKFTFAVDVLIDELNDKDFWYDVAMNYNSWKYLNGVTFFEFKEKFLSGKDNFNTEIDHDLDIYINFYYSFRSVVGYTTPRTWWTWINRKFFNRFDYSDIAGNIVHEYLHNMGFDHPGADKQSLVYQLGFLVKKRIKKKLKIQDAVYKKYKKIPWWRKALRFFT